MKVALYARVSTNDQGQNPETQLFRLRAIAQARGHDIFAEYVDQKSGKDSNRPALEQLMRDARQHKFDLVMVTRLDRMMRSTKNLFTILDELKDFNVGFQCTEQEIQTTGAMGKLILTMLSAIAEFERELGAERREEGTARALAEGKLCHRPRLPEDKVTPAALRMRRLREQRRGAISLNINGEKMP
jgi:DNA invertase Pin-like site-specific DNA recombinase